MPSIAFFGTEQFAAEILETLISSGGFDIQLVVTQPDKPVGRKQIMTPSPVKIIAEKNNLKIAQPDSITSLTNLKSDNLPAGRQVKNLKLNIVCQYGLIIPQNITDTPELGSVNIHPSLLPKYRGASPIQSVLLNGETKTGVSIMLMDAKMDHGPILAQQEINIGPDDNFEILHDKLLEISKPLLVDTLEKYLENKITPEPQDDNAATFCKMFTREDGKIDWNKSAEEIYNQYRGLTPWPGVWTTVGGKRIKLLKINSPLPPSKLEGDNTSYPPLDKRGAVTNKSEPGGVKFGAIIPNKNRLLVSCGENAIEILELQPEGKKAMSAVAWKNGNQNIDKFE